MMAPVLGAKSSGFLGETVPPHKKYRYFTLKIPVFALKQYRYYPKPKILFLKTKTHNKARLWLPPWPLGPSHNRRGSPEKQPPPRLPRRGTKAPKSPCLPRGSLAPSAVSRLSLGRFGPDFEPPAPWGQLEVFLPLTTPTLAPHSGPVIHLSIGREREGGPFIK